MHVAAAVTSLSELITIKASSSPHLGELPASAADSGQGPVSVDRVAQNAERAANDPTLIHSGGDERSFTGRQRAGSIAATLLVDEDGRVCWAMYRAKRAGGNRHFFAELRSDISARDAATEIVPAIRLPAGPI